MEDVDDTQLPLSWMKAKTMGFLFATIAVRVLIAFLGHTVANAEKEREIGVRYVELALGILSTAPKGDKDVALRHWATDVLSYYSAVALTDNAKLELSMQKLDFGMQELDRTIRESRRKEREIERQRANKP